MICDDVDVLAEIMGRVNAILLEYINDDLRPERVHTVVAAAMISGMSVAEANLYAGAGQEAAQRASLLFFRGDPN